VLQDCRVTKLQQASQDSTAKLRTQKQSGSWFGWVNKKDRQLSWRLTVQWIRDGVGLYHPYREDNGSVRLKLVLPPLWGYAFLILTANSISMGVVSLVT
jgi:hypothetical protein